MTVELIPGDNRISMLELINDGVLLDSCVTDAPYHLLSVVKRFGKPGSAAAKAGRDGRFTRHSSGFMGQSWDGADADGGLIAQDPAFWRLVYDLLKPGAYVAAFSSARTGHWQAVAMEMAGFIMHPMIGWITGQGFPKAHSVSKAIDEHLGVDRKVVDLVKRRDIRNGQGELRGAALVSASQRENGPQYVEHAITEAGSPEAAEWEGWFYSTQTLKPALEPIYIAQKPFSEKNGFLNILKHRTGAMNIDGTRVMTGDNLNGGAYAVEGQDRHDGDERWRFKSGGAGNFEQPQGRWPANLIHDGSAEVIALFPDSKGQLAAVGPEHGDNASVHAFNSRGPRPAQTPRGDDGSAARFFNSFPPDLPPILYVPKATAEDRAGSKHPTVKPVALMRHLCRLLTPPGGTVLDPFAGSGTTGVAALAEGMRPILMEREQKYLLDMRVRFGLPLSDDPEILELLA